MEVLADGRRVELGGGRQRALLALLLLHVNEVVSTDRLVEELWGERPPATAVKALQGHVSQLRRALAVAGSDGTAILATRPPGYVLNVAPEGLDARRFEDLLGRARRLLPSDPKRSAELLREALALWRGEPLAEVAYEPFAQAEIARLRELRFAALEDRIEADLMLGRHQALVPELEALVEAHPLRERLRSQLMVALYRSGRQADALEAYRDARHALVDGLGVEPGPDLQQLERAILTQDPALASPPLVPLPEEERAVEMVGAAAPRRRRWRLVLVLAALVLAGVAILAAFLLSREGDPAPTVVPNSLVEIDPKTNKVVQVVRVGRDPFYLAAVGKWVFATNLGERTLSRVDVRSREVRTVANLDSPVGLAAAPDGTLWIGSDAGQVTQLNPPTLGIIRRLRPKVPAPRFVAVGGGSLWVSAASFVDPSVVRVSLPSGAVEKRFVIPPVGVAAEITFGEGSAWVALPVKQAMMRIGALAGTTKTVAVVDWPSKPAVGFHEVWIASSAVDRLYRVDPLTLQIEDVIGVGDNPTGVATGADAVWVTNEHSGTVSRIDPRTDELVATIPTGFHPHGVVVAGGSVWVAVSARRYSFAGGLESG